MTAAQSPTAPEGVAYLDIVGPEGRMARSVAKAGLVAAPLVVLATGLGWGWAGAASGAYALAIVVVNFALAAVLQGAAAKHGPGALVGAVLGGYLLRLGLIAVAVLAVKDAGWVDLLPLCLVLVLAHLGLLAWEAKQASFGLATPGQLAGHARTAAAGVTVASPTKPSPTKPSPTMPSPTAPSPEPSSTGPAPSPRTDKVA